MHHPIGNSQKTFFPVKQSLLVSCILHPQPFHREVKGEVTDANNGPEEAEHRLQFFPGSRGVLLNQEQKRLHPASFTSHFQPLLENRLTLTTPVSKLVREGKKPIGLNNIYAF